MRYPVELCLKNLNQLASIGLVDMDEDCFVLKPTGSHKRSITIIIIVVVIIFAQQRSKI